MEAQPFQRYASGRMSCNNSAARDLLIGTLFLWRIAYKRGCNDDEYVYHVG
jgi:hypothetical protein